MPRNLLLFFIAFLLMMPLSSIAKQELRVGVGNFSPFFIEKEHSGLFLEITQLIFNQLPEYQLKFVFMSNNRLLKEINKGEIIDVACNIFKESDVSAYLSSPVFRYTDVAVSKKSANLIINNISDLQTLSIVAYQGAKDLLGEEFSLMAKANPHYLEHAQPKETTYLLLNGSKEVRIGDIYIFLNDLKSKQYQFGETSNLDQFSIHYLWPDVYSHMAFKNKPLRNKVNNIIRQLNERGEIEAIYNKYLQ